MFYIVTHSLLVFWLSWWFFEGYNGNVSMVVCASGLLANTQPVRTQLPVDWCMHWHCGDHDMHSGLINCDCRIAFCEPHGNLYSTQPFTFGPFQNYSYSKCTKPALGNIRLNAKFAMLMAKLGNNNIFFAKVNSWSSIWHGLCMPECLEWQSVTHNISRWCDSFTE